MMKYMSLMCPLFQSGVTHTPNKLANVPSTVSQTVNNKSQKQTVSFLFQSPHCLCYLLLPKLMEKSTLGYSHAATHHQSAMLKVSRELFCDEALFTFFFFFLGVSTFPQPPLSATSVSDSLHFQECLMATSREQMLTFPIETKLNNASSCVPFAQKATCFVILIFKRV